MSSLTKTPAQESASADSATSVPAQASTSRTESTLSVDEYHALQYKKRVEDRNVGHKHHTGLPAIRHGTQPAHEIFTMGRNVAVAVMDAATLWWSSANIVVLKDQFHDISRVTSAIHERSRAVTLEWWTKAAGRKLRPHSFWIVFPALGPGGA
ncbi:hypothetical protein PC128_g25042 [Phytophthora cactorum]|nr:hypothetical protein PC128_g25042 [Phytophthora cactorum]